jgi:hypothetical protein
MTFMEDVLCVLREQAKKEHSGDGLTYAAQELLARWKAEAPRSERRAHVAPHVDGQDFYELCQEYRHSKELSPRPKVPNTVQAFDNLRAYIKTGKLPWPSYEKADPEEKKCRDCGTRWTAPVPYCPECRGLPIGMPQGAFVESAKRAFDRDYQAKIERDAATMKVLRSLLREAHAFLNAQAFTAEEYQEWETRYKAFTESLDRVAAGVAFITDTRLGGD